MALRELSFRGRGNNTITPPFAQTQMTHYLETDDDYHLIYVTGCDCNGHAEECRFDPAVFAASGNVSGGVCVSCLHNTVGRKCEKCKPLHFQDPSKDFRDEDSCIRKFCH